MAAETKNTDAREETGEWGGPETRVVSQDSARKAGVLANIKN